MRAGTIAIFLACLALSACGGNAHLDFVTGYHRDSPQLAGGHTERLYIATTRVRADDPRQMFTGERSPKTNFATVDVSIPPVHKAGFVERPEVGGPDPRKHFVAYDPQYLTDEDAFVARINTALAARAPADRHILLFVHGFNNSFDEATLRFAQIENDARFPGVPVLFTWPSRGSALDYLYDRDSATASRDALERTMKALARTNATRIDVLAHSMGTWLTMETLRQIRIAHETALDRRIGDVILAAPDISIDVFKAQMKRYGRPGRPFYVLISRDDRALAVSRRISGNSDRVGDYNNDVELASLGLTVVDLSAVDSAGDRTNHSKFAANPDLVRLLGNALRAKRSLGDDSPQDLDAQVASVRQGIGTAVGNVAGLVITAPVRIITAPLKAAAASSNTR